MGDLIFGHATEPSQLINVAAVCTATRALGPGLRAVVWVQGCAFHCPGCIAPDWIAIRPARLVPPELLAAELLANPEITGLTFSGGEPMLQAAALARLARLAKAQRNLDIICFTGFVREPLEANPPVPGVWDLLEQVDVLIDGPYIQRMNDNTGLRGSRNQRVHYLTNRLTHYDLTRAPRQAEVQISDGHALLVGVPPHRVGEAYNRAIERAGILRLGLQG